MMKLIMTVPLSSVELRQAIGKMMAALIIGIGPELQSNELIPIFVLIRIRSCRSTVFNYAVGGDQELEKIRKLFNTGCTILSRDCEHFLVQSEAITCFQRLHLFDGNLKFDKVIPVLYRSLTCPNLTLRRTAVDCFRQLCQRDAELVCKEVNKLLEKEEDNSWSEYGLAGALFIMMDRESDELLLKGIKDTLTSILLIVIHNYSELQVAVSLCKAILTAGIMWI